MAVATIERGPAPQEIDKAPPGTYLLLRGLGNRACYSDLAQVLVSHEEKCDVAEGRPCGDLKVIIKQMKNFRLVGIDYFSIHVIRGGPEGDPIIREEGTYEDFNTGQVEERKPNVHVMLEFLESFLD